MKLRVTDKLWRNNNNNNNNNNIIIIALMFKQNVIQFCKVIWITLYNI